MSSVAKSGKAKKSKTKPVVETALPINQSINQHDDEEEINANDTLELSPVEKKKKSKKSTKKVITPVANPVKVKSPSAAVQLSSPTYNRSSNHSSPTGLNLNSLHPDNADLALDVGLEEDEDVILYSVEDLKKQRADQERRNKLVAKQRKEKEKEIQAQKKKQSKSSPRDGYSSSINQSISQSDDLFDDEESGHSHPHDGGSDGFTTLKGVPPNGSTSYYLLLVFVTVLTVSMIGLIVYYTEHVPVKVLITNNSSTGLFNISSSSTGESLISSTAVSAAAFSSSSEPHAD